MGAEHHAHQLRVRRRHGAKLDAEIDAGALPRQVAHLVAEDFAGELFGVGRRCNGDHRVRVHVVHMRPRHIAVQAGIDRGCARIEIEDAVVERVHHRVFLVEALVERLQGLELVHVEGGEAVELHGAEVTARALHPQHSHVLARQRVLVGDLGGGVAAAEVGDAEIGTEEVGPVQKFARLIERLRVGIVPLGLQEDVAHAKTIGKAFAQGQSTIVTACAILRCNDVLRCNMSENALTILSEPAYRSRPCMSANDGS